MSAVVTAALVALVAAIVQRYIANPTERERVFRQQAAIAAVIAPIVIGAAVASRGFSLSSIAIVAATTVTMGAYLKIVYLLAIDQVDAPDDRITRIWRSKVPPSGRRLRALGLWLVAITTLGLVSLRYAGALQEQPLLEATANVAALGQLEPLVTIEALKVGQCLRGREPEAENEVVPCGAPHRAQIMEVADEANSCSPEAQWKFEGLDLELQSTDEADDHVYCYLRSTSPVRTWSGRITTEQLAETR